MTATIKSSNKHSSLLTLITQGALQHELEISGALGILTALGYSLGIPIARKCISISYKYGEEQYGKGKDDFYFVAFWFFAFTFLRAVVMNYVYKPLAVWLGSKKPNRFAEQGFVFTYYIFFWSAGMAIMYNSPHWRDTTQYWIGYPHMTMTKYMKSYYLMQIAFWFQQIYTLHTENRRKDHVPMLVHHIITITLVLSSYYTNFTRIGNAVLCCMDLSDIFLALAKGLRYLDWSGANVAFGAFALSWPITRHYLFGIIIWATIVEPQRFIDMKWEPERGKYMTPVTQTLYVSMFIGLNILMMYWLILILKVIFAVLRNGTADDNRSDDEDDSDDPSVKKQD